ncbi:MAG TPA: helix-turn-helix domain-containing protein [Candidatus Blautia stercoravium]|nr:helix-turn-helix domain-containing protein [Candidatus Blautia stercoravium]
MISASDRKNAVMLIKEAVAAGESLDKACEEFGFKERTYYRWIRLKKETGSYDDLRPNAERKTPANKLSAEERQTVIETVNQPEYASMPPCELVPALADKGIRLGQGRRGIYRTH